MSHITQALIDEAVAYCLTGRRPPFTVHEIQQLLNAWQERDTLRAQLAAAEARAERLAKALEWIRRKLFVQSWGGTLGAPSDWRIAGDYRHTTQRMKGPTLLDAVESAALAEGGRGER